VPGLDVALAAAVGLATVMLLAHGGLDAVRGAGPAGGDRATDLDVVALGLGLAATVPLAVGRQVPVAVFVVSASASALLVGLGYSLDLALGPAVALYLIAASRRPDGAFDWSLAGLIAGLFAVYLAAAAGAQDSFPRSELLHSGFAWAVGWVVGERTGLRREHIADLTERAQRAEREAARDRRLAAAEERARIARDLHDSAGHAISVIALRAGAARLRSGADAGPLREALAAIEDLARRTASEIDGIVSHLREPSPGGPGAVEAPTGLASLDTLVGRHRAAGLDVTVAVSGPPAALGAAADQAAYRILQEALTNAARHGVGSARVEVAAAPTGVTLTVTNPIAATVPRAGRGHGLVGMQERATLVGGSLEAGPVDGAFRVHAHIPGGPPEGDRGDRDGEGTGP